MIRIQIGHDRSAPSRSASFSTRSSRLFLLCLRSLVEICLISLATSRGPITIGASWPGGGFRFIA
jgi:hypothetical protein